METSFFAKLKPNKLKKILLLVSSAYQAYSSLKRDLPDFLRQAKSDPSSTRRILVASTGCFDAKSEAIYAGALGSAGFTPYIIAHWDPFVAKIFSLFAIRDVHFYNSYYRRFPLRKYVKRTKSALKEVAPDTMLNFVEKGICVGKYAASSFMRITRQSNLNLGNPKMRSLFAECLCRSFRAADIANAIIDELKPTLLFVNDRGYTPEGQLFDACLNRGVDIIQRCGSHKGGFEILKRYRDSSMSQIHHHSLSDESWDFLRKIPWNEACWQQLFEEVKNTYISGEWFSEVGTQFNKKIYSKEELCRKLGLSPDKKTAVVFPHIFWDATFFWGKDLFNDYYDWFVNVLKVAKENTNLNWVIKIHPANIVKARRDNYRGQHKELTAVYEVLGELPSHIKVIEPETDINTFSLFSITDYCLTVRGTIGIEAAMLGITTLTAGTGRYDGLGFTHDFQDRQSYLDCLKNLEKLPAMNPQEIELARRFAYGIFILRPIHLDILEHGYEQDERATMRFKLLFSTQPEYENSQFVKKFREFVLSDKEDFLDLERIPDNKALCVE